MDRCTLALDLWNPGADKTWELSDLRCRATPTIVEMLRILTLQNRQVIGSQKDCVWPHKCCYAELGGRANLLEERVGALVSALPT